MIEPTQGSPKGAVVTGLLFGAVLGSLFGFFFPAPPAEEVSLIPVLIGNAIFAAVVATMYYFLFRGMVANTKLPEKERTKFAGLYFMWIGLITGMEGARIFFGGMILDVVTTIIFVIVGISISYRKLFQLYRANSSGGGTPPTPPVS